MHKSTITRRTPQPLGDFGGPNDHVSDFLAAKLMYNCLGCIVCQA
jgi:hypothetical protein